MRKPVLWVGSTLDDIRLFPDHVKREIGHDLDLVQQGLEPRDFKPMQNLGSGILEIRIKEQSGAYRLVYVAKYHNAIYCLHAFQKKTEKTAKRDIEIIKARFKAIHQENNHD